MAVIPSISAVVIVALGEVTDLGLEIGPEAVTDLAQAAEIDRVVVTGLALVAVVTGPVPEQDQVRDKDRVQVQDQVLEQNQAHAQVQGLDQVRDKDLVPVTKVPLVARARAEGQHPGTVNAAHRAVPVNLAQEVHLAEVVVDVAVPVVVAVVGAVAAAAEVVVADVDVDLK